MKAIFEDEGYIVDLAATGSEAIQKSQNNYNVALLDIRLPDMEGVDLLKLLKENTPRTRKIMITGYPSMQNAMTALNKNADAYLIKPVNIEKLLITVQEQLKLQDQKGDLARKKWHSSFEQE